MAARYGQAHRNRRAADLARVRADPGAVPCARCGTGLWPDDDMHEDHDDDDPTRHLGLAHADCNLRAGSHLGHHRRWGTPLPAADGCPDCGDTHGHGPCPPHW